MERKYDDEECIVGSLLLRPQWTLSRAEALGLTAQHFSCYRYQALYVSLLSVPLTLLEGCNYRAISKAIPADVLADIGGMSGLLKYADRWCGFWDVDNVIAELKQQAYQREIALAITHAADDLNQLGVDAALARLQSLRKAQDRQTGGIIAQWSAKVLEKADSPTPPRLNIGAGVGSLDYYMRRLVGGELVVLAGRPGSGKTALAGQVSIETASAGTPVVFFSAEMSGEALSQRWLLSEARITLDEFDARSYPPGLLLDAHARLSKLDLRLEEVGKRTVPELCAAIRAHANRGAKLVVIDYLQRLDPGLGPKASGYERVTATSLLLTQIALETGVVVLALAQMNRQSVANGAPRDPSQSDLRESGQIEQDADLIMMLNCPDKQLPHQVVAHITKNRSGPIGNIPLIFHGEHSRFEEPPCGIDISFA
jgi:replicative DNA helicase